MKSIEPIILAVSLGILALGSALLAYFYPSASEITGITSLTPKGKPTQALNQQEVDASLASWNSPTLWTEPDSHARMFESDRYLFYPSEYPAGDYIRKFDKQTRTPSGVLISWYLKYGLDFTDPNVDRADPDNDGFSNLVEFKNDPEDQRLQAKDCDGTKSTNPLDPNGHPSYLARLRLQQYELKPFHMQFKGYQQLDGVNFFQIHLDDVPSDSQPKLKKTGDQLGFEGFVIGEFHQIFKMEKDPATGELVNTDESTLEIDRPDIDLKVILPFRKVINSPESTADFVMLLPTETDKVIKVTQGKIFNLNPYIPDVSYKVISAGDDGAVIRDTKTNEDHHVLKLDPKEWDEVPVAPAATTANNGNGNG